MTMINGEVVVKEGRLTKVDEKQLFLEGEKVCNNVLRNPHLYIWKNKNAKIECHLVYKLYLNAF